MNISLNGISKHYALKKALNNVSVDFTEGKIHALLGENGAGKSTLAGIISGSIEPTCGSINIDGKKVTFKTPKDALNKKIVIVQQRPLLSSSVTARENILLGTNFNLFTLPPRLLSLKEQWCPSLPLNTPVKDLGGNYRFYISLLKALLKDPKCLILDEPSAFLDINERKELYSNLRTLASSMTNIIVITHSTAEAVNFTDDVTLLKKGELYKFYSSTENYKSELEGNIIEQKFNSLSCTHESSSSSYNKPCFIVQDAFSAPKNKPVLLDASFEVSYGNITAINGIKEAAMDTLEDLITGMNCNYSKGSALFYTREGKKINLNLNKAELTTSFLRKHKTAIVPSDRTFRASNPVLSMEELINPYNKNGKTHDKTLDIISKAQVNIQSGEKASNLSGGMLQRLILAREIDTNPDFIILCNPLQGLDIQSQGSVSSRILNLSSQGKAVLIIGAQDFPLSVCDRVYTLESGILKLSFAKD